MTVVYELDCTDCSFRLTLVGEFPEVLATIDSHRDEREATSTEHFVNVHRLC